MIRCKASELALLKRFEIPEHPLRAEAYAELEPAMINDGLKTKNSPVFFKSRIFYC